MSPVVYLIDNSGIFPILNDFETVAAVTGQAVRLVADI